MQTLRVERVLSAFRGSSWPVLVQTTSGRRLVVKLRGTAQGLLPLVAELVVGALADVLALATPQRLLTEIDRDVASDDPHEELVDLLRRSAGLNLGLGWLEGYRNVTLADAERIKPELAAAIVWLDAFVQNPDRTAHNTNLMIKAGQIQLIDHGAALDFHHDWRSVTAGDGRAISECRRGTSAEADARASGARAFGGTGRVFGRRGRPAASRLRCLPLEAPEGAATVRGREARRAVSVRALAHQPGRPRTERLTGRTN
jgi:hypothetical protein